MSVWPSRTSQPPLPRGGDSSLLSRLLFPWLCHSHVIPVILVPVLRGGCLVWLFSSSTPCTPRSQSHQPFLLEMESPGHSGVLTIVDPPWCRQIKQPGGHWPVRVVNIDVTFNNHLHHHRTQHFGKNICRQFNTVSYYSHQHKSCMAGQLRWGWNQRSIAWPCGGLEIPGQ